MKYKLGRDLKMVSGGKPGFLNPNPR
ncbi:uncharacterized protein METZ01_LOCUS182430 [marine metagenome]|uniref:Uncharacterized protein n=1 Tax=marine metagenome TaxID=408172 RepID=A0A382CTU4_9ZZZZ